MVLKALEVIDFIAMRPTDLDTDAFFGQRICHMQQFMMSSTLLGCLRSGWPSNPAVLIFGHCGRYRRSSPAGFGTGVGQLGKTTVNWKHRTLRFQHLVLAIE